MNKYQKEILTKLMVLDQEKVRYSGIQLSEIDNDKYNYHLQQLVKNGFLSKEEDSTYSLSQQGTQYIAQLDAKGAERSLFRVSVLAFVTRDSTSGTQLLMQERTRKPYQGDKTTIAGKILPAERIEDAANRKLKEETGLDASFEVAGVLRAIRHDKDGDLLEDIFFYVCKGHNPTGELEESTSFGRNYWGTYNELIQESKTNKGDSPDSEDFYKLVEKDTDAIFYITEEATISEY